MRRQRERKGTACRILWAAGCLASAGTALGFLSSWSWLTELASHFRVQYLAVLAAVALLLVLVRSHRSALLFGGVALTNVAAIYPLYVHEPVDVGPPIEPLRVMLSNVYAENDRFDLVLDAVADSKPDVVVLLEVDATWLSRFDALSASYPYSVSEPREDNFGIALYSRHPLSDARVTYHGIVPSIAASVRTASASLYVVATHPMPPVAGFYARLRNRQLEELGRFLRAAPRPLILLGDLNVTPWSAHFARLLEDAGLEDSMKGYGPQFSWPAQLWPVRLPIDHCLYSPGVRVRNRQVGPFVGSDHYPLIVDLEVGSPAVAAAR